MVLHEIIEPAANKLRGLPAVPVQPKEQGMAGLVVRGTGYMDKHGSVHFLTAHRLEDGEFVHSRG